MSPSTTMEGAFASEQRRRFKNKAAARAAPTRAAAALLRSIGSWRIVYGRTAPVQLVRVWLRNKQKPKLGSLFFCFSSVFFFSSKRVLGSIFFFFLVELDFCFC